MKQRDFELIEDASGRLVLRRADEPDALDVRVRRSFPWTAPQRFISLRGADGAELMLIEDLAQLPPQTRRTIERWLEAHTFVPAITRVDHVDVRFGHQQWFVQTSRGATEFRVQEREDIRFLPDGRFSIRDADGTVYELGHLESLDPKSRRAIEALL